LDDHLQAVLHVIPHARLDLALHPLLEVLLVEHVGGLVRVVVAALLLAALLLAVVGIAGALVVVLLAPYPSLFYRVRAQGKNPRP
jgi:uncharacterized membrane protein YkgB